MAMAVQSYGYGCGYDNGYGYGSPYKAMDMALAVTMACSASQWSHIFVAILAAMALRRITFNVAVHQGSPTSTAGPATQVHTCHLLLPDGTRPSTRLRRVPGSTNRTLGQAAGSAMVHAMTPSSPGTPAWSDGTPPRPPARSSARHSPSPSRDDVDAAAGSARDVEAGPSDVEETMEADRAVREGLRSDDEDEIPRPCGDDPISSTDAQRADVQADPDVVEAEGDPVVGRAVKRRRRLRLRLRPSGAESARAGPA